MFSRALHPQEEEIIKGVVALMAQVAEANNWVWTEKDYACARRLVEQSFGEGWVSRVAVKENLGVVGWAAAYEATGKLWKTRLFITDRYFKGEGETTVQWILRLDLEAMIESCGGIPERIFYRTVRRTDLTGKLSRN